MLLTKFLQELAEKTKSGDNADFQALLGASALNDIEVPEDTANAITGNLNYSKEVAKNDEEVEKFFFEKHSRNIYGVFEDILNKNLHEFGLSKELKDEILEHDSAAKKFKSFLKEVQRAKVVKPDDFKDIEEKHNREIEGLNNEISDIKTQFEKEKQEIVNGFRSEKHKFGIKLKINSFDLVDNEKIAGGKDYLADAVTNQILNEYHIEGEDFDKMDIRDKNDPTREVYEENKKISLDDVLNKKLSPFIKRSEPDNKKTVGYTVDLNKKSSNEPGTRQMTNAEMIRASAGTSN